MGTIGDVEVSLPSIARTMELKTLLAELVASLSLLDFVASIDLQTQTFTLCVAGIVTHLGVRRITKQ